MGAQKLGAFCREVAGIEPDNATCFVFVNSRGDTLLLYFLNRTGEQTLTKKLDKGSFLLPARDEDGAPFVTLRPIMLSRLFRTSTLAVARCLAPNVDMVSHWLTVPQ